MEARFCRKVLGEAGDRTVVEVLELDRWDVVAGAVQPAVVEPVDVLQGGEFDVVEATPGAAAADELGLVQDYEGLGGGVGVALAAYRPDGAGGVEAFGVADGQVPGGFNWSSQHPDEQGCDDGANSSMGVDEDRPPADALAGAAAAAA